MRGNIDNLVKDSAELIAIEVIKVALTGQLATAKYLFEAVGLYPATEQTAPTPVEGSLAHTLLTRMGLPTEPVICDEDEAAAASANDLKAAKVDTTTANVENEVEADCEDEPELVPSFGRTVSAAVTFRAFAHGRKIKSSNAEIAATEFAERMP